MDRGYHFIIRKVHSLLGIIPLGIFLIWHFYINSLATLGHEVYDQVVSTLMKLLGMPYFIFVELFLIMIPLVFHGVYGLYIAYTSDYNAVKYAFSRNWAFVLQRLSGIVMFVFLVWHVWHLRLAHVFIGRDVNFAAMADIVSTPLSLGFFITGIIATAYHFANGIWSLLITWGITIGPRSQKITAIATTGLFLVLAFIGVRAILAFV